MKYILAYRHKSIDLYRTDLKLAGKIVAFLGFVCIAIAVFPNGLGLVFYPLGFFLLGSVGISTQNIKRKIKYEVNLKKMRFLG